ncbi:unnamed protein product [Microthlaspi erraticum]|uniref:PB1 domain-containing protein n=1 Tax=Microthlaspi erraticum TaxID=1685480 RepID=A0A6D2K2N9_9BRAS|nr:unnamed protein product [Microthlaspi erraticum]
MRVLKRQGLVRRGGPPPSKKTSPMEVPPQNPNHLLRLLKALTIPEWLLAAHLPVVEKGQVIALLDITKCLYGAISRMEKAAEQASALAAAVQGIEKQWGAGYSLLLTQCLTIITENSKVALVAPTSDSVKGRVHRFSCGGESLEELMGVVMQRIGGGDGNEMEERPQIVYEDDEGDKVLIMSDSDLVGAVSLARSTGQKVLRLHLDFSETTTTRSLSLETGQVKKVECLKGEGGGWVSWRGGVVVTGAVVLTSIAVVVYLKRSQN